MKEKITQLAEILKDYRVDEGLNPKEENIEKWVSQFSKENQEIILDEMIHICNIMYFSKKKYEDFLQRVVNEYDKFYWKKTTMLEIQKDGHSQKEMLSLLKKLLKEKYNLSISINDFSKKNYIYIDDFLFSGVKLKGDLQRLKIKNKNMNQVNVHYMGYFSLGKFFVEKELKKDDVIIQFNNEWKFENRKSCKNISDILLPIGKIYNFLEVKNFLLESSNFVIREEKKTTKKYCHDKYYIFSSEKNRQILEKEFTLAGLKIIDKITHNGWAKPLGFSSFKNLGFGAMIFTYRNCPNNTPLCLWWGDWDNNQIWYPLFQRNTYK